MRLKFSAEDVWKKFKEVRPAFVAFRDASYGPSSYSCTLNHCFRGFETALKAGIFDRAKFDLRRYEFHEKINNGDMNWVIPGKIMALSTPNEKVRTHENVR